MLVGFWCMLGSHPAKRAVVFAAARDSDISLFEIGLRG